MMDRRRFVGAISGVLIATPMVVRGQPAKRVYRLAILSANRLAPPDPYSITALLTEFGYVEGENLVVERRFANGKFDLMPRLASELARLRPDVIYAIGSVAIRSAMDATRTIPIVFLTNGDPVAAGFVRNLARPGGNITGVLITPQGSLAAKRVELLRELVPRATRMALLAPDDPGVVWQQQLVETRTAAAGLGLILDVVEVRSGDYARAFSTIAAVRPQALVVAANSGFLTDRKEIIELAAKYRLPAIYEWPRQVKEGGLMSYGANDMETNRQVASYIDRVFKGVNPGEVPVWQPSSLHLVINLKTAKALGMTIPQTLLLRAETVEPE